MSTKQPFSYHILCELFNAIANSNQHGMSIVQNCTKSLNMQSNYLIQLSLASLTPIAQFFVDAYFQCVLRNNSPINAFMDKSKFLSLLSHNTIQWRSIRKYLSEFLKHVYVPVAPECGSDSQIPRVHNMSRIMYYTSVIHENIYILNKVCQVDIVFIPQPLKWIDDKYFAKFDIKYEKLNDEQGMKETMRHFNEKLKQKFQRCVILIMANKDICEDTVYMFQPLTNNSLRAEIHNYTEIEWFCNTKATILPDLSPTDHNALCLSFHRHIYHNDSIIERVYLSYGDYACRVFKYNFMAVLKLFCRIDNDNPMIDWEYEIKNTEFKDNQYELFLNVYFADMKLHKPSIEVYLDNNVFDNNKWNRLLCQSVQNDKQLSLGYMYIPLPMRYYEYMNTKIGEYYESMNKVYNDQFVKFIYDNELENCELEDSLGECVNDCVLLDFDTHFPIPDSINMLEDEFLFTFLRKSLFL